jgi:hypothetical protein
LLFGKLFLFFNQERRCSLSLSQSWKTYFSPSSFILLSVSLITFLLKNDLNMYTDVPLRALCFVIWRALTGTNKTISHSPLKKTINQRGKSEFYQDGIGFSAEMILWKGFFGHYVFRG